MLMQITLMEAIALAEAARADAEAICARDTADRLIGAELDRLEFEERKRGYKRKERWEL